MNAQNELFGCFVIRAVSRYLDGSVEWAGWLMDKETLRFSDDRGDCDHAIRWLVKDHADEYASFLRHKLRQENLDIRVIKLL